MLIICITGQLADTTYSYYIFYFNILLILLFTNVYNSPEAFVTIINGILFYYKYINASYPSFIGVVFNFKTPSMSKKKQMLDLI